MNYGPRPFFYIKSTNCLLLCVYFLQTITSFHSIRLILCFQQNRGDWQPHRKLGTEFCGCVVQVSMLLLAPVVRPANVQLATPLVCFLAPTKLITLVLYWGKTCCYAHHTFLLGFPNELDIFWAISSASGKSVPQLEEQKHQSCPPLKVISDIEVGSSKGAIEQYDPKFVVIYREAVAAHGLTIAQYVSQLESPWLMKHTNTGMWNVSSNLRRSIIYQ